MIKRIIMALILTTSYLHSVMLKNGIQMPFAIVNSKWTNFKSFCDKEGKFGAWIFLISCKDFDGNISKIVE